MLHCEVAHAPDGITALANLTTWWAVRRFTTFLFSVRNRDTDIRVCVTLVLEILWGVGRSFRLLFLGSNEANSWCATTTSSALRARGHSGGGGS